MRWINNPRVLPAFIFLICFIGLNVEGQDTKDWDKSALKDSITVLFSRYQSLHNNLYNQPDASVERSFIHLFSNPKVQVANIFEGVSESSKMSIEAYVILVGDLFPNGLIADIDIKKMSVSKPVYDRNNRYLIDVHVNQAWKGITDGKVFSVSHKLLYQIAFYDDNGIPDSFQIYGMEILQKSQSYVTAMISPSRTQYVNSILKEDSRWSLSGKTGFSGQLSYGYYLSDHLGIGSGIQFSYYSGDLQLDHFDPYGGFDPNMSDIEIQNSLWYVEVPVFISTKTRSFHRWSFGADLGVYAGFRAFEKMSSFAVNTTSGDHLKNVISDSDWIARMHRLNLGWQGTITAYYQLNDWLSLCAGVGIRRSISGLDGNSQAAFTSTEYQGQYNPLWGAPGKTIYQAVLLNMGVTCRFNNTQNK